MKAVLLGGPYCGRELAVPAPEPLTLHFARAAPEAYVPGVEPSPVSTPHETVIYHLAGPGVAPRRYVFDRYRWDAL